MTRPMSHGTWETRTETTDQGGLLKWLALEDIPTVLMNFAPHIRKSQPPDQYLISYHMVGVSVHLNPWLFHSTAGQLASPSGRFSKQLALNLTHPIAALGNVDIKLIKFFEFY